MTKVEEFFKKSQALNQQVWDVMVRQAVEFSRGKNLDASYDAQEVQQLEVDLQNLRSNIQNTYGFIPSSLKNYYNATLEMIQDIRNGALLLSKDN